MHQKVVKYDEISPNVIRQIAPLIAKPLSFIFSQSGETGITTDKLNISLVTPEFKGS